MTSTPDIFLSYNREDQVVARLYADAFAAEGLNVWWDAALRSGEAYDEVTEEALRGAKAVVVLWSPRSVVSRWVRAEATIADRCKTLVPVTIEACERPIMFELTQTAELSHWTGDAGDKAWQAFLGDVRGFVGREVVASAPVPPRTDPAPVQPGERGDAPTLAVMPFTNRSGQSEDDVFAYGMVEDIIDALSQCDSLNVLASSATRQITASALPNLAAMATELGVRYVLEGNIRRTGESLRVTAQLIDASNGKVMWTERFERMLSELAAMQEDLVMQVARQLDASVNRLEVERILTKPGDLTAWEAATRASAAYTDFTGDRLLFAAEQAKRAVEIDPDYGLAHSTLAMSLGVIHLFMAPDSQDDVANILRHADRAINLAPNNCMVQAQVALTYCYLSLPQEGLAFAERAVRLRPGSFFALAALGPVLVHLNRVDEGIRFIDKACQFSMGEGFTLGTYGWKGIGQIKAGRWREAEATEDEILSYNPTAGFALMHKAVLCHRDGRIDEARKFIRRVRDVEPDIDLTFWVRRISNWHADSPTLEIVLDNLRAAWLASEPGA